jgi:hypothetical protein
MRQLPMESGSRFDESASFFLPRLCLPASCQDARDRPQRLRRLTGRLAADRAALVRADVEECPIDLCPLALMTPLPVSVRTDSLGERVEFEPSYDIESRFLRPRRIVGVRHFAYRRSVFDALCQKCAISDDEATMCVLDSLGRSSGAAAEQQYSEVCRRGAPQADRCLGLGYQIPDRNLLPQADHVSYA